MCTSVETTAPKPPRRRQGGEEIAARGVRAVFAAVGGF
jgi:hypothetical protein